MTQAVAPPSLGPFLKLKFSDVDGKDLDAGAVVEINRVKRGISGTMTHAPASGEQDGGGTQENDREWDADQ